VEIPAVFHELPSTIYNFIQEKENVVLLETSRFDADNFRSFLFVDPIATLQIHAVDEVPQLIEAIEDHLGQKHYLAGYLSYDCGFHFEQIAPSPRSLKPIAFFGVYRTPFVFNHQIGLFDNEGPDLTSTAPHGGKDYGLHNIKLGISRHEYARKIETIRDFIRAGDTYQINFTTKYTFDFEGSPLGLYRDLKEKQRVPFGAFIKADGRSIVCLSPELFFKRTGDTIVTKPMKGTTRRGKTNEEDRQLQEWLRNNEKSRAENVMIVDLLRNDIGRIAEPGSVHVPELFSVEKYQTLFQMTSTIEGTLTRNVSYYEILRSLFPCGSVTGAPRIRSMQIINELEQRARGVYTGAIGYFSPHRDAVFNVAIRTAVIEGKRGEMGVGSGIVYDSNADQEYAECELKGLFLTKQYADFDLLETLLWDDGYPLLERHLKRLQQSAEHFEYRHDIEHIRRQLLDTTKAFNESRKYKVRLRLNRFGETRIEHLGLDEDIQPALIALTDVRTNSSDRFLYHKTTHRCLYDEMSRRATEQGLADFIFLNERGEVTEGAISNIFVGKKGRLITPPVGCGLLNGIYRQYVLEREPEAVEAVLTKEDIHDADAIYICNAVRGMRRAVFVQTLEAQTNNGD
jgi:para-aminobenzoate synthetase/4-amino-4-deoxychorismate lyase